jgi:Ion channel
MLGAIAAYLMVGMSFAFAYRALGALQAGPFFGSQGEGSFPEYLFFSFTTLTTTGYGNLVPAANPGQTFARPGDADRAAVPGDGGGQGGEHLATRPRPRAPADRNRQHLSRAQQVVRRRDH